MHSRRKLLSAVVAIVLLIIVFVQWFGGVFNSGPRIREHSTGAIPGQSISTNSNSTLTSSWRLSERSDPLKYREWEAKSRTNGWDRDPQVAKIRLAQKHDSRWDWKQPIDFWGVVVDEVNRPIPFAKVKFSWNDLSRSGSSEFEVLSDQEGFVELLGRNGKCLTIVVEKDGYRQCGESAMVALEYAEPTDPAYHRPDPNRPIILRLIKLLPPEPLVQRSRMQFRVDESDGSIALDLLGQRRVSVTNAEVDLGIKVERGPALGEGQQRRFDWRVVLEVNDGGIMLGSACKAEAPSEGYANKLEFQGRFGDADFRGQLDEWFFMKSRSGQHFTKIHLGVSPAPLSGGTALVNVYKYLLNPSGSRNLEEYKEFDVNEKYYKPVK